MYVEKEKATTNYSYTFFLDGNSTSTFHKIKKHGSMIFGRNGINLMCAKKKNIKNLLQK